MFCRQDNLIVTQSDHSHLSGQIAFLLGRVFGLDVTRLSGAIALHDWPHFAGAHADTIEIGKKSEEHQLALVNRLSGEIPVNEFTEIVIRLHWQRLTEESDIDLRSEFNQKRIEQLRQSMGLDTEGAHRIDRWTDVCDALAFYLSRGSESAGKEVLPDLAGEQSWSFHWTITSDSLSIHQIRVGRADSVVHRDEALDVNPFETELSLLAYDAENYPQKLAPQMRVIRCRLGG